MAKRQPKTKAKWNTSETDILARAFLSMKDSGEMKNFMRDLLTESEIIEFGKRFFAARSLASGVQYTDIVQATGLSSRTIARIQKWVTQGKGGYRLATARLKK